MEFEGGMYDWHTRQDEQLFDAILANQNHVLH